MGPLQRQSLLHRQQLRALSLPVGGSGAAES